MTNIENEITEQLERVFQQTGVCVRRLECNCEECSDPRLRFIYLHDQLYYEICPVALRVKLANPDCDVVAAMNEHFVFVQETGKVALYFYEELVTWPVSSFASAFRRFGLGDAAVAWFASSERRTCFSLREHVADNWDGDTFTVMEISELEVEADAEDGESWNRDWSS